MSPVPLALQTTEYLLVVVSDSASIVVRVRPSPSYVDEMPAFVESGIEYAAAPGGLAGGYAVTRYLTLAKTCR